MQFRACSKLKGAPQLSHTEDSPRSSCPYRKLRWLRNISLDRSKPYHCFDGPTVSQPADIFSLRARSNACFGSLGRSTTRRSTFSSSSFSHRTFISRLTSLNLSLCSFSTKSVPCLTASTIFAVPSTDIW
ncbi:unnamed protein product [Heterosigma akashiwo]